MAAAVSTGGGDLVRDLDRAVDAAVPSLSVRFRRSSVPLVPLGTFAPSMCLINGVCGEEAGSDTTGPPVVLSDIEPEMEIR